MIQLNDFARQWHDIERDAIAAFTETGENGWYILGCEVQQFERALAGYWKLPCAVGVASGLDAIEISLRALRCGAGDRVLTSPVSAFATTLAILKLGAVPVYSDIDKFGLLDLDLAREALHQDSRIRYFVPVHLYGHALDSRKLAALQEEFGVAIVEDCAQSIGAAFNGTPTGHAGDVAATSFYPTKNLGALGDGGAILTRHSEYDRLARALRDYGQTAKYQHDVIGYNSRLDEVQAALLRRVCLPRLGGWTARRREIASIYLTEIDNRAICLPGSPPDSDSCWHLFPVVVAPEYKTNFIQYLKSQGIVTGEHYPMAIPDQKAVEEVGIEIAFSGIECARRFCRSEVSLPIHPYLTNEEVSIVVESVNNWMP